MPGVINYCNKLFLAAYSVKLEFNELFNVIALKSGLSNNWFTEDLLELLNMLGHSGCFFSTLLKAEIFSLSPTISDDFLKMLFVFANIAAPPYTFKFYGGDLSKLLI